MRLDHFIAKALSLSERDARLRITKGSLKVDGRVTKDHRHEVSKFTSVETESGTLRKGIDRCYLMFHKPKGILSATKDLHHRTVLDFIDHPDKETFHLAGRLDRSSSGLILITNDGNWSESLTDPAQKVSKHYWVETDRPIPEEAIQHFADGFEFQPEGIKTRPARLVIHDSCRASVTLEEGRYHQIKRMFHRLDGIRLRSLHRDRIGAIQLPPDLPPGSYRSLETKEIQFPAGS